MNESTFSGAKNDTVELNTNFKTIFKNFMRSSHCSYLSGRDLFLE